MAKEWRNETTKRTDTQYCDYPENIIVIPELCGRHDHTPVEDLAADIEANGQSEPCLCRSDDNDQPVLVFGHRRYRAISLLNERNPENKRKVVFRYAKLTVSEAFALAIGENRFRKEVSPMDDCVNMATAIRKFGWSEDDLSKMYFPEASTEADKAAALRYVKNRLALQELSDEAATAVREGRVKLTAAVALAKLTKAQQREKVAHPGKIKGSDVKPADIRKETGGSDVPSKPSGATRGAENSAVSTLLELADAMYAAFADLYGDESEVPKAAKDYKKARGI